MNKRSKKEIKLQNTDKYTVKYGSLNKEIPEVIYIRAKTKIIPKIKKSDYSKDILGIKDEFNRTVKKLIVDNKSFGNNYICHFDTNGNGMTYNKKSFLKYDVYVKPSVLKNISDYECEISSLVNAFNNNLSNLLEKSNMFYS